MGIFDIFKKSKNKSQTNVVASNQYSVNSQWVHPVSPPQDSLNQQQIDEIIKEIPFLTPPTEGQTQRLRADIETNLKHAQECVKLVNQTNNPDVYFKRYNHMITLLRGLAFQEDSCSFTGELPSTAFKRMILPETINANAKDFVGRYLENWNDKISKLKTQSAKSSNIVKCYTELSYYFNNLSEENMVYFESEYREMAKSFDCMPCVENNEEDYADFVFPFSFNKLIKVGEQERYEGHNDYYMITDFYKDKCFEYADIVNSIIEEAIGMYPKLTKVFIDKNKLNFNLSNFAYNDFCMLLYHPYTKNQSLAKHTFSISLREKEIDTDMLRESQRYGVNIFFDKSSNISRIKIHLSYKIVNVKSNTEIPHIESNNIVVVRQDDKLVISQIHEIVGGLNYCYGDFCRNGRLNFCFGASEYTENPFGCHRLQISATNNPWYSFSAKKEINI